MTLPKVSVHIIAYNQEEYIREAIDSALAQDYPNLEVVVADDASTDGTPEILLEYQRANPGRVIAVLGERNLGLSGNGNRALKECTGDFIAFMGGDDILLPGKISAQADWLSGSPQRVLCAHQVEVFYEDGSKAPHPLSRRLNNGRGAEEIIRYQPFGAVSVMVRANRIPAHGYRTELPMVSDNMMWIEVLREDGEFGCVRGTLARYRRHNDNVTRDPFRYLGDVERHFEILEREFPMYHRAIAYAKLRRLHYDVGTVLLRMKRSQDARREFLQVLQREPFFVKTWIRLMQTYL